MNRLIKERPVKRARGTKTPPLPPTTDPVMAARAAGLRYVTDAQPGIRRVSRGKGFAYYSPENQPIRDQETLSRIRSLVIPPAWKSVWICPHPAGHLQATGRDDRGRKQHRYHPRWREVRDATKYDRMIAFARILPRVRRQVTQLIQTPGLSRDKVLATIIRLLEVSLVRVGNEEYARHNKTYGLTTLQDRHAKVNGEKLQFFFKGKSGKWHDITVEDRRMAKIVKSCQDLPGQDLFQYLDDNQQRRDVTSDDVNQFISQIAGQEFTAKDFRTWAGTVLTAQTLYQMGPAQTKVQLKSHIAQAIKLAAARLGNTVSVCRKCYVHPLVLDAYSHGELHLKVPSKKEPEPAPSNLDDLSEDEQAVLDFLQSRASSDLSAHRLFSARCPPD